MKYTTFILLAAFFFHAYGEDFDITKLGAKDGADSTQAVLDAWKAACGAATPSKVIVPPGKFTVNEVALEGPCKAPVTFQVDGTLLAPADLAAFKTDGWFKFQRIEGFTLAGKGTFDGQGSAAWSKNTCTKTINCDNLPTNIRLDFLTNSVVRDITSLNSKMFHFNVLGCKNVTITNVVITAPETSANTDGVHIARSDTVTVSNVKIQTGDDCISFGDGSKHVIIEGVNCGPGHGISVGSLGKFQNEEEVLDIKVRNCTLTKTMFGVRVKTWPGSPVSQASEIHFEDITMDGVSNPVLIDQQYCPWSQCKAQIPSKVKLSNVSFKGIRGTSATQTAVKLACSPGVPCDGVEVGDISLTYNGKDGPVNSECTNVKPVLSGKQVPAVCTGAPGDGGAPAIE